MGGRSLPRMQLADRMGRLGTESAFEVLARARALEATGRKVIHLEIGEPDFDTPQHICDAAAEALASGQTHYVPAPGIPPLREAVAEFLERNGRMRATADRVVVTPGAKPIMFYVIMALCQEGDEVLYPNPAFPMYESITAFAGATPVPIPLREENQFRIDPEELATLVTDRTKLLILNTPHNPCGSALTREDVERIAEIAMANDLIVLTDEVYWAIRYDRPHSTAGRLVEDVRNDGVAAGVRRLPAGPGGTGDAVGHQLGLVHVSVQPARRDRRVERALGAGAGDDRGVPPPPRRDRGRAERNPGHLVPGARRGLLRVPQRRRRRRLVQGDRGPPAERGRRGLPVGDGVRRPRRGVPPVLLRELDPEHPRRARGRGGGAPGPSPTTWLSGAGRCW